MINSDNNRGDVPSGDLSSDTPPVPTGREPVLVVEDAAADAALIRRAFRRAGVVNPLVLVGDGDAAVAYLGGEGPYADRDRHPYPALVLLDLKLPRRSGHEVLAWLRAQPRLGRLPVVVLTSSRESPDVDRAYDLGANGYLVKPVEFADLLRLVQALDLYWLHLSERPTLGPARC